MGHFFTRLDAYGCMLCLMLLTCSFLCSVFIIYQASTTMAMTTTPLVTVGCSITSSLLSAVTIAPSLVGLPTASGQHDMVLPPPMTLKNSRDVGSATVPHQQPQSQMPFQVYANYAMVLHTKVSLSELSLPPFFICLVSVMVYTLCFQVLCWMQSSPMGAQPMKFTPLQPFGAYPWQAYVQPGDGHWPIPGMQRVAAPSTTFAGGSLLLLNQLPSSHSKYIVGHRILGGFQSVIQSLHLPCVVGRGLLYQVWLHVMTQLTLNLWWALNLLILVW